MCTYLFNRSIIKYDLINKDLNNTETVFVYEEPFWEGGMDKRSMKCLVEFNEARKLILKYKYNECGNGGILEDGFEYCLEGMELLKGSVIFDDIDTIKTFVEWLHNLSRKLVIDITSMNIRLLSVLISNLVNHDDWERVFVCYSEPNSYRIAGDDFDKQFLLNNKCFDSSELPGIETTGDYSSGDYLWYVFLGFEGGRYSKLEDDITPKSGYEFPVISIPPMKAAWHNYAVKTNLNQLNSYSQVERIKYVSATNPFEVFNFLTKEKTKAGDKRLLISPLGTKVVTLGIIMYLLEHPEDKSLTDCPVQVERNSDDSGVTHYYDLTYYINSRENIRFSD